MCVCGGGGASVCVFGWGGRLVGGRVCGWVGGYVGGFGGGGDGPRRARARTWNHRTIGSADHTLAGPQIPDCARCRPVAPLVNRRQETVVLRRVALAAERPITVTHVALLAVDDGEGALAQAAHHAGRRRCGGKQAENGVPPALSVHVPPSVYDALQCVAMLIR